MHTQNVNTVAFESSKTWVNGEKTTISASQGQKICVSANELHTRWHAPGEKGKMVTPAAGAHCPPRNGSYGADVLLLNEADVLALMTAGHTALPRLANSAAA